MSKVAAIDIGTNSILLTVVEIEGGTLRTLRERSRITRLGEGLNATGRLSDEPMRRSLDVLREYLNECQQYGVQKVLAVGTEVLRRATNAQTFLQACEQIGLRVEVISGEREAQLSYLSVAKDPIFIERATCLTMIDIGGGSVEISRGCGGTLQNSRSYPIGAVRLTEAYLQNDPPTPEQIASLRNVVQQHLQDEPVLGDGKYLVGVGGTFVNIASLHQRQPRYDPERVHGATLTTEELRAIADLLCGVPLAERRNLPGIEPDRAPVLHAGASIALTIMEHLQAKAIAVSMRGLRWGLLYEYADAHCH